MTSRSADASGVIAILQGRVGELTTQNAMQAVVIEQLESELVEAQLKAREEVEVGREGIPADALERVIDNVPEESALPAGICDRTQHQAHGP